MLGRAHLTAGTIMGVTTGITSIIDGGPVWASLVIISSSMLMSDFPDVDLPKSSVGVVFPHLSKLINKCFGHRTITHTWQWIFLYLWLVKDYGNILFVKYLSIGLMTGFISHLLCDLMTSKGIPIAYPFVRKTFHLSKIKSGKHDYLLMIFPIVLWIILCMLYLFKIKGWLS